MDPTPLHTSYGSCDSCSVLVNAEQTDLSLHVANDGTVIKSEIETLLQERVNGKTKPVLVLIPIRLGVDHLNPVYFPMLKYCFEMRHCVGIAGGRPRSSLYFLGAEADNLVYLDPHYTRNTVPIKDVNSYGKEDLLSYHCHKVRLLPLTSMDPSMVLGFYIRNEEEFNEFYHQCLAVLLLM